MKSVIYAVLDLPPPGAPLDFPDTPQALVVVDVAELAHKPMPAWEPRTIPRTILVAGELRFAVAMTGDANASLTA